MGRHKDENAAQKKRDDEVKVINYCTGCLNFKLTSRSCKALKEPYPLWAKNDDPCWARKESPHEVVEMLKDIREYSNNGPDTVGNTFRLNREIEEEMRQVGKIIDKDVKEVYHEASHPYIYKMGGGEKADRTNKTFGPQAMKDNRFMHRKNNPRRSDWND